MDTTAGTRHWTGAATDATWVAKAHELAPRIGEHAARHDRDGDYVHDSCALLREQGFLSMLVPASLGGGDATFAETCAALSVLAHGCPSTALALSMHTHLVAAQVWRHHRDLPAPVLGRVVREQVQLVSTGASDWVDSNGTATRVDGGFRVSARKSPASGCPSGDVLVTSIRCADGSGGATVLHFAVPMSAEGVRIEETWDTMGMRATGSHTVVLDDVFVPEAAVSLERPTGRWHPVWNTVLGVALPLITSVYVGVAESAAKIAVDRVRAREDAPVAAPLVGRMLGHLRVAQDATRAAIDAAGGLRFDATDALAASALERKSITAEAAIATVRGAIDVIGGAAYSSSTGVERLLRDVHGVLFHPLPGPRQEQFCGRVALGLEPVG